MKNKSIEFFNLSFLDLLSGALASVIFLFIIVPKGEPLKVDNPLVITYDTLQHKFYGMMPDTLRYSEEGDTLFAVIGKLEANPEDVRSFTRMEVPDFPVKKTPRKPVEQPAKKDKPEDPEETVAEEHVEEVKPVVEESKFAGSKPDVPCVMSIEIKWGNKRDNVDLFVCKDNDCVFGGRRSRDFIGQWDSGKSRTSWFGGDIRTNQEAVRQFDALIPGTYEVLVQYKESEDPKGEIPIRLQVYTRNEEGVERGKEHYFKLSLNPTERRAIAKVTIGPEGELDFQTL